MNTAEQLDSSYYGTPTPEEMETIYQETEEDRGPWPFSEAPEEVKQAAIEKHRYFFVEDNDWADCIIADFISDMAEKGIDVDMNYHNGRQGNQYAVPAVYWSGFSSQGDGACFEGSVSDLILFLNSHFGENSYPTIRLLEQIGGGVNITSKQSGHYCHCYSCSISLEAEDWERCHDYDEDDLRLKVLEVLMANHESECNDLEEAAQDAFRDHMKDLYRTLEKDYYYRTSDEGVSEGLDAGDHEIDEDGDIV